MLIIGCDYHPSVQQIAWMDTETGECGERRLKHCGADVPDFGRGIQKQNQKQNPSTMNEASLDFVSLRSSLHYGWVVRAVKGRDECPAGTLDSPPDPRAFVCSLFA